MRTTTDTLTGKPFRWNSTVVFEMRDGQKIIVPARYTSSTAVWLHPGRTPAALLASLNP